MRRFLADASHDLRTPLTALRGNLDVLRRGAASNPADLESSLTDMHESVIRMSKLVNDLLTLARLEQTGRLEILRVEVAPLLRQAARLARHLAGDHRIKVEVADSLAVRGDPDALHQVLLNLIDNAAKYSPSGRPIVLRARSGGSGRGLIEVIDRGQGIPAEDRERIFQRFVRGDRARSAGPHSGAGLGLSIVAALVARQGGRVSVESEPGTGSTFRIDLPEA
jgi:two-component system OmpR family sensor kinase